MVSFAENERGGRFQGLSANYFGAIFLTSFFLDRYLVANLLHQAVAAELGGWAN